MVILLRQLRIGKTLGQQHFENLKQEIIKPGNQLQIRVRIYTNFQRIKSGAQIQIITSNISKIQELHNIHVEIVINSWRQNNLHLSSPSNMQEQLNVDIFSSHGQSSLGQEQHQVALLEIFGHPNKMLDWQTNQNLIFLTNI